MNENNLCQLSGLTGKLCWISILTGREPYFIGKALPENIQDDIPLCHDCDRFKDITSRGFGRRAADETIILTTIKLMEQLAIKKQASN